MGPNGTQAATTVKVDRAKFGRSGQPIKCHKAYRRDMPFDHKNVHTESWIFVTAVDANGKPTAIVMANLYDGRLGRNYSPEDFTYQPDEKRWNKWMREYSEVPVSTCPVAELIQAAPANPETPANPEGQTPAPEGQQETPPTEEKVDESSELLEGTSSEA